MAKPEETFRIGGEEIAIWKNEHDGDHFLNASLEKGRSYKDGDDWKTTHNYNAKQLAVHIALCQTVLHYMVTQPPSN